MQSLEILSKYILKKFQGEVTPMKLQKLLYYVKVWTTVVGNSIIPKWSSQSFYAWKFGPVNPTVYHKYKGFGKSHINLVPDAFISDEDEKKLVDFILDSYGCYNAITLSKTTHTEDPWLKHKDDSGKITDEDIKEYYSNESFSKNFPLDSNGKYHPPKTSSYYAYVFDMKENDEASEVVFDSVDEYKQIFMKTAETIELESDIFE